MMYPAIIFLVGPTAVGKSEVAACLAKKIGAEIISCDSMQIYKGMDIVTSTPSAALRKRVRHHLLGKVSPEKAYDVARYRHEALKKIKEIIKRGRIPLFVGGTGLYMSMLVDGIFQVKSQNESIRKRLYREAGRFGNGSLHRKLQAVDPEAALRIHPNDTKRMIRALEAYEVTGRPISQLQRERKGLADEFGLRIFCLNMSREALYKRIDERLVKMFRKGLVREARILLKKKLSKTASFAIGLPELKGHFEGEYDLAEAKRLMRKATRNYAKRQLTWFRKDKRIEWVEVAESETPNAVAGRVMERLRF
jgi:tRNA dimethylallyltransferase